MKSIIVAVITIVIAISTLFKGLFFPFESYVFFAILLGLTAVYFIYKIIKHEHQLISTPGTYLGGLLLLAYFIAFSSAVYIRGNIETILQYSVYFIVFLVVSDYFKDNKEKVPALVLLPNFSAAFIVAIIGLAGYTKVFPELADAAINGRIGSTLQYANTTAIYFLINIIFIIPLILNVKNVFIKSALAGIGNVIFMSLFFTASRGVYIIIPFISVIVLMLSMPKGARLKCAGYVLCITMPILVSMKGFNANSQISNIISASKWIILSSGISVLSSLALSYLLMLSPAKKTKYILAGVSISAVLAAFIAFYNHIINTVSTFLSENIPAVILFRLSDINLSTKNVVYRFEFFKDAGKLIKDHWLTGLGGGGFAAMYQSVQDKYYTARLVHNHYLQIFTESGILGFLAFSLFTVASIVLYIIILKRTKEIKTRIAAAGCFCSFFALAVHSAIDFNLTYNTMSLLFWCLAGIAAAYQFHPRVSAQPVKAKKVLFTPVLSAVSALVLISFFWFLIPAASYADQGEKYIENIEYSKAIKYYENAAKKDPKNAVYQSKLSELYNWRAGCSKTVKEKNYWRSLALKSAEKAVKLNKNDPYYNFVLTNIYFDAEKWIEAYKSAKNLIKVQPKRSENYELLARGALEAGMQYFRDKKTDEAEKLINECAAIEENDVIKLTETFCFYKGKALLLLDEMQKAEELLKKARNGSLELKMESDRLLYIINEETGRSEENSKYKGVIWMGMVKNTPVYKDVKNILHKIKLNKGDEKP